MEFFEMSFLVRFILGVAVVLTAFVYWLFESQNYFEKRNISCVKSYPLIGSFFDALSAKFSFHEIIVDFYNKPGLKDQPFFGFFMFHKPALMIADPEIIKRIFVSDFHKFSNRHSASDVHDSLGYYELFGLKNPCWKTMRAKFTPFFNSSKLKVMYCLVEKICDDLNKHVHRRLDVNGTVELKVDELSRLFITDVIASCFFGVEANSLENPDGEFIEAGKKLVDMTFWRSLELTAFFMLPEIMKLFKFKFYSYELSEFVETTIRKVMDEKEKHKIYRNDLIDTLIELKYSGETIGGLEISMDMLLAQAAGFLVAGSETSSSIQAFSLYEMTKNPRIQEKVRSEIREMLKRTDGKVTYDILMSSTDLPYLHQVISETLRIYPVLPVSDRECTDSGGFSLEPHSSFKVPYKMPVWIPVYAIHHDEKYFPNPMKFVPDRFSPKNIKNIKSGTYLPFGIGPRQCIGERFSYMQIKAGIVNILKDFRMEASPNTPNEIKFRKKSMVLQSEKPLILNLIRDPLN